MAEPSGAQWCARFPTSTSVVDLAEPFQGCVTAFLAAIRSGGGSYEITATRRPAERAYLMHWAWAVGRDGFDPAAVPPHPGVGIAWVHTNPAGTPDLGASIAAARAMVQNYDMAHQAVLDSRHIEGRAIDMDVAWSDTLAMHNAQGTLQPITSGPRNGQNVDLHAVGRTYGVIKLVSDPPHWSDDGH